MEAFAISVLIAVSHKQSTTQPTAGKHFLNLITINMSTKTIQKKSKAPGITHSADQIDTFKNISIDEIDYSPLNYRKHFSRQDLDNFAAELLQHGIISPLTVRKMLSGRFELVAGERRLRAARIARLKEVPAIIKTLSDEEVVEIQLAENIQRENPHPMHEAQAIGQMQKSGKNIDEIAARLGKSRQFVYGRIKLLSLIEPFQEMFLADKITLQQAIEIAGISTESQQDFFDDDCRDWKSIEDFFIHDLQYALRSYKYDLKNAPFNTKDKKLVPEAGACNACPSNTATLKSLFPEYAKQAICSNKECYHKKCTAHVVNELLKMIEEHAPKALLFHGQPSPMMEQILSLVPATHDLPKLDYYEVTILSVPEAPDKEDFTNDWENDESEFDEEGYLQAMEEYRADMEAYQMEIEAGNFSNAILVTNREIQVVFFSPEKPPQFGFKNKSTVTAKEVQAAIKTGTATKELLEAEIERIQEREKRAQELDRDKVQLQIHEIFSEQVGNLQNHSDLTEADCTAARMVIYQSLDYTTRSIVDAALFEGGENEFEPHEEVYESLKALTEQQYAYLIRMSVLGKSESKLPNHESGRCLYSIAEAAGVDIKSIEEIQLEKATSRSEKQLEKIDALEKKIKNLKPKQ
jgi:ParB family transcriptional regulator, chromosome partitioning protein